MRARWGMTAMVVATVVLSTGCATAPRGPSVQVLPGTGKPFEQFQADVEVCRGWAAQQVKGAFMDAPSWEVQRRYDNAYVQCMYAKGHQVPSPPGPPRAR
jgi:hypothetical protein